MCFSARVKARTYNTGHYIQSGYNGDTRRAGLIHQEGGGRVRDWRERSWVGKGDERRTWGRSGVQTHLQWKNLYKKWVHLCASSWALHSLLNDTERGEISHYFSSVDFFFLFWHVLLIYLESESLLNCRNSFDLVIYASLYIWGLKFTSIFFFIFIVETYLSQVVSFWHRVSCSQHELYTCQLYLYLKPKQGFFLLLLAPPSPRKGLCSSLHFGQKYFLFPQR